MQRGDIRAVMQALRASGTELDPQRIRHEVAQQLRVRARPQADVGDDPPSLQVKAAADQARAAGNAAAQLFHRKRPPTVQMGDRPGEARWIVIVAALLAAAAVWVAFGGP